MKKKNVITIIVLIVIIAIVVGIFIYRNMIEKKQEYTVEEINEYNYFVLRENDKYSIVDNYTRSELEELGYSDEEISNRTVLTLYDEIMAHPE